MFNRNQTSQPADESWKAQGFLNFYLPSKGGPRRKLGAIPLKDSKPSEREMLAWLNADPSRVTILLSKLELEYQSAVADPAHSFDLSIPAPANGTTGS